MSGSHRPFRSLLAAAATAAMLFAASGAPAQSLNFGDNKSDLPIEVQADEGIEWQQDGQVFLARGNARATRGDVAVHADLLRAYYRKGEDGSNQISRLDALGNVRIVSKDETAYGDAGVYDVDKSILVLSGKKVRLVAEKDEITADQQLEYYDLKQMAIARGNAVARSEGRTLQSDVLVAYFKNDAAGEKRVQRVEAFDNIHIVTDKDEAWADRGVYNADTGIASLTGEVRIARGENVLAGCSADVNLNTGVSKLKSCADRGRVRGLLKPGERGDDKKP